MRNIVANRLDSLLNNVRGTFSEHTHSELKECEKAIDREMGRLEYIFGGYRVASPANIDSMINKFKKKLGKIKDIITDHRDDERRETIRNLEQISIDIESTIQDLERCEVEGIRPNGQDDGRYEQSITQLIDDETARFVSENGITDKRIIEELKAEMRGLKRTLVHTHDEHSVNMKYSIKKRAHEIGEELVARKEEKKQTEQPANGIPGLEALVAETDAQNSYFLESAEEVPVRQVPTQEETTGKNTLEDQFI